MIFGCNKGTDWTSIHEGDTVKLILHSGQEEVIELEEYREEVYRFADRVEAFFMRVLRKRFHSGMSLIGMDILPSGMSGIEEGTSKYGAVA